MFSPDKLYKIFEAVYDATNKNLKVADSTALPAGTNNIGDVDILSLPAASLTYENFGAASNLAAALNSAVTYNNAGGFSSIAFRLTIPTGATVTFEATFDDSNWTAVTLRQIGDDGYVQTATASGDYIGSIAGARQFRVRVSTAGSAAGSVIGRAQRDVSVSEGAEHQAPPHKYGYAPVRKGFQYTTQQTNAALWTPASGKKFVVTDLILTVETDGTITIFDNTNSASNWLVNLPLAGISLSDSRTFIIALRTPFVGSAANNVLKVTTSAAMTVEGVVMGYEA